MDRATNSMRENYMVSEDFFMAVAYLASKRSKDPMTQVGACIVDEEGTIVGVGHNHMPKDRDDFPWAKDHPDIRENKYLYVCHAGITAILNKNSANVKNCTMYVTMFPSCESGKIISQAGIKEIVYLTNKYMEWDETNGAERMFDILGIKHRATSSTGKEWDHIFMAVAYLASKRSKDPVTKVGACIVKNGVIVGVGHNHMPQDSDEFPWDRTVEGIRNKYPYVCHAGLTAILNSNTADLRGSTIYITLYPSAESAKVIAQVGISEVVFMTNKYQEMDDTKAAKFMFETLKIRTREFEATNEDRIVIDFNDIISRTMEQ